MSIASEIKIHMDKSMNTFEHVIDNLKDEDLNVRINEGEKGWTVIELLRHIQNSERGMTTNLKSIINKGEGTSTEFDLQKYNHTSNEKMKDLGLSDIKENMKKYRKITLELLKLVKEEDWEKEGRHPSQGTYSVKRHFEIISWHQYHHLKGIKTKLNL
ncbi:MAG: hypothetical protein HeimC2_37220 [Candidatus Heimdallarchaeota archaeon LC_2]|nr:MAG: hypothetical protein HeimC2_37220 [Candidatus Heimdallarchaeota archaeon LC_2]